MTSIKNIISRQILDSRGYPTVETDVITTNGVIGRAAVPSGASTGQHEAIELRDELNSYMGKSVFNAVKNVNDIIFKELENLSVFDQSLIDSKMIKLDNTPVSNGDIKVNEILTKKLSELTPNIAIVSEENSAHKDDKNLKNFWLIDPIDGTNDYINNRDEFTINAALILNKKPAIGIITAPAKGRVFYSYAMSNSYELINNQEVQLSDKKKEYEEIKAVSYTNQLKPEILEIHLTPPAPPPPPDPLIGFPLFTPGPLKTEVLPLLPLAGPVAPPAATVIG